MKKSYDINVIVWYYDTILTTVMKLIYYKANYTTFNPNDFPTIKQITIKLVKKGNIREFEGFH